MSGFIILGLIVTVYLLWQRMSALTRRVDDLVLAARFVAAASAAVDAPAPSPFPFVAPDRPRARPLDTAAAPPAATREAPPVRADDDLKAPAAPAGARFEDLFGRRLPIWAGGLTLAIAGLLIVRYSVEAGLLSPAIRVIGALLFGAGLIAGAEAMARGKAGANDPRLPQALTGAGVASLYGAVLAATDLYGLIGSGSGFVGLAGVTLLAGLLALRFGAPSALLGLVGGLAAPALVASASPSIPSLAAYLALTVGGLCTLARRRGWQWLGAAAIAGGFGWNLLLIVQGGTDAVAALSTGALAVLLAAGLPALLGGRQASTLRTVSMLAGAGQIAAMVALGGFGMLAWSLYGLLALVAVWLGRRETALASLPSAALAIALMLTIGWPTPEPTRLAIVIGGTWGVFGLAALVRLSRDDGPLADALHPAALAFATGLLPVWHFPDGDSQTIALPSLIGAALLAIAATIVRRSGQRDGDARFAVLTIAGGLLIGVASALALPAAIVPPAVALIALALLGIGRRRGDARIVVAGAAIGGVAAVLAVLSAAVLCHAVGIAVAADGVALVRLAVPAGVAMAYVAMAPRPIGRIAQALAMILVYAALAQALPAAALPLAASALLALVAWAGRRTPAMDLAPGIATAAILALAWALMPVGDWMLAGLTAVGGEPLLLPALPSWPDTVRVVAMPALAFALVGRVAAIDRWWRRLARATAAALAVIALHILYRHALPIDTDAAFVARGMMERTLWEMLLAAGAWLAWRRRARRLGIALGSASLAHFGWFTLIVHDPLWSAQAVGPWGPVAFATTLSLIAASAQVTPAATRARAWAAMTLIVLLALMLLRQVSAATMLLSAGTAAGEDIARSVLAVALSIACLRVGLGRGARDWRIGSLALMIAAVAKVFLHDAAGLDGLARIASFAALGFSLIGIGWLYSRYLPDRYAVL